MNPYASSETVNGESASPNDMSNSIAVVLKSFVGGSLLGFLCFVAIGMATSGTVPTEIAAPLPCSMAVCLLPPLVAPLVVRPNTTLGPPVWFVLAGIVFTAFAWTLFNLAIRSAVFISPDFAHRIPDALTSIDHSIAIVLGILMLLTSAWLSFRNCTPNIG